ncbi:hypothetical protein Vafri_2724 [Volvox africanus]|uniref:Uncharacterized protein n=1 Tax=Volvox africanus TaxID=51714 RepID=A0A8J4ATX4_9CHLO|nr:hypothetical protein Vafri_2724 [Volvox africanus]
MESPDSGVTVCRTGQNLEETNKEEDGCSRRPGSPPHPAPLPHRPAAVRARTEDVVSDAASFRELMISDPLVHSLVKAGFERPSPVQKAAIPLGRIGTDLIVQAKSGTGKTVVFAVICLERIKPELSSTQALILAPTREIAIQSEEVIRTLASELPAPPVTSAVFVGGLPMLDDEKKLRRLCHVAVGTPGRVGALLQVERLVTSGLTLLVLDEVDSLLGDSFYEDVTWIYDQLPKRKQVLAFSATYTPELLADLEPLMRRPQRVMMCSETVSLLGVKQFYELVPAEPVAELESCRRSGDSTDAGDTAGVADGVAEPRAAATASATPAVFRRKVQQLLRLLGSVSFHQVDLVVRAGGGALCMRLWGRFSARLCALLMLREGHYGVVKDPHALPHPRRTQPRSMRPCRPATVPVPVATRRLQCSATISPALSGLRRN